MKLVLCYHPLASFCWKPLVALYENETPFERVIVDLGNEESRTPTTTGSWRACPWRACCARRNHISAVSRSTPSPPCRGRLVSYDGARWRKAATTSS